MKTMLKCACMTLALMLLILPAAAEEATISVTGSATIYLEADLAELNIGVRIKSEGSIALRFKPGSDLSDLSVNVLVRPLHLCKFIACPVPLHLERCQARSCGILS